MTGVDCDENFMAVWLTSVEYAASCEVQGLTLFPTCPVGQVAEKSTCPALFLVAQTFQ